MRSPCFILSSISLILIGILYWLHRTTIVEPYTNLEDDNHMRGQTATVKYLESINNPSVVDMVNIAAYDDSVFENDKTIFKKEKHTFDTLEGDYTINDIATDIMNNIKDEIDWNNVFVDDTSKSLLNVIPTPAQKSIKDMYGRKGILNSEFKEDICKKYVGDPKKKSEKCQELSAENCKLTDCCILLNGTKCIAGNTSGPIFLTEDGVEVDQRYFFFKETCYGDCDTADSYAEACGKYTPESTGISKECMIKIFNNYGCPNPNPDDLINDRMVKNYKKTSMRYVNDYIKTAVDVIYEVNSDASMDLCNGT